MNNAMILIGLFIAIILFFWGVYKTTKTQKKIYLLYMLPMVLVMIGMFFI